VISDKKNSDSLNAGMISMLPRLWRFAVTLSRQRALAEDLVQQTCQRALERRHQFETGSQLDHWLFSIMSSIWKNHLRAEKVRRGIGVIDAVELWDDRNVVEIEQSLMQSKMQSAVAELPLWQRETILLVYVEEMSYQEAATALNIPIGTVMSRIAAAKLALAAKLNPERTAERPSKVTQ
jgi:RNA polymerase sigma-70 factor, ECF subfamily